MPRKRPFGVTLLMWMVLTLTVWGALRSVAALHWWDILVEFDSSLGPLYLALTGAGWSVAGCVLLWSMFTGRPWAPPAVLLSAIICLLEYWLERTLFQAPRADLPFALIGTVLILIITLAITRHKGTREFFTRSEEYEQQDENPGTE